MKDDIKKLGVNPFYHRAIPTKKECERIKKEIEEFNKKVNPIFDKFVKQILKEMRNEANNPKDTTRIK